MKAGWARVNITPPLGVPLAGYYVSEGRTQAAQNVLDELHGKALVLDDGTSKLALVATDLIHIPSGLLSGVREVTSVLTGIPTEHVVVSASHNHSGPALDPLADERGLLPCPTDSAYVQTLARKLGSAVALAAQRVDQVDYAVGTGSCDININRRERRADGSYKPLPFLGQNPDGPVDHTVTVAGFRNRAGASALLVNYPCHAVVLGANHEISADFPGAMQRFVEDALAEEVTAFYTNGAQGDVNPIVHPGPYSEAVRLGRELGCEVVKIAGRLKYQPTRNASGLAIRTKRLTLPVRQTPTLEDEAALLADLDNDNRQRRQQEGTSGLLQGEMDYSVMLNRHLKRNAHPSGIEAELTALRIGDLACCTVPGELFTELGLTLQRRSPAAHTALIGLANGSVGYLPTAQAYHEGGFEVEASALAPNAGELLVDTVANELDHLFA